MQNRASILLSVILLILSQGTYAETLSSEEVSKRVEILADEINQLKAYQMSVSKNESAYGLSPSASKVYHIPRGLSVGGYGEITYLNQRAENESGDGTSSDPTSEVLRNILYVGYKFNDKWLVNMELEIEHVSQVYTEFMYLDYLHSQELNFRGGLLLHPIGFLNELHEPTVFQGVLRPQVESVIIPTTWRELGVGIFGNSGKSSYKVYAMNGMNAEGFTLGSNRGGRKRGGHYSSGATATEPNSKEDNQRTSTGALVFRYDYQVSNNLTLGTSGLIGGASGDTEDLDQRMLTLQGEYVKKAHKIRFLMVENRFSNADEWNDQTDDANNRVNNAQQGGYLEYNYSISQKSGGRIVPFIRHEMINLQADRADGNADDEKLERTHTTVGVSYFPHEQVVLKADYTMNTNEAELGRDVFALGMGYNF
jgi:hypothetical protein